MKLSSKRHGKINVFYYKNPIVFHRYTLNGSTIAQKLNWMFKHIADRYDELNQNDLKLVAGEVGVHMMNRKTGGRMYVQKTGTIYLWHEETLPDMATMHEDFEYNQ
jgi:hypothetical protein